MKNFFKVFTIALTGVIAIMLAACNNGGGNTFSVSPGSLEFTSGGDTKQVTVTSETAWTATTSNEWITINNGSGSASGTFHVTAGSSDAARTGTITVNNGTDTKTISVNQLAPASIAVEDVVLDETFAHLITRDADRNTITLQATVMPANADNQNISWSSNADGIATVSGGVVTAVAPGSAVITVTTDEGGFTAQCEITVTSCGIIISDADLADTLPLASALEACPEGWRLPTITEWQCMCQSNREGDGIVYTKANYWSSSRTDPRGGDFIMLDPGVNPDCNGMALIGFDTIARGVRCVKDVE